MGTDLFLSLRFVRALVYKFLSGRVIILLCDRLFFCSGNDFFIARLMDYHRPADII